MITSEQLQATQKTLEALAKNEIDAPMTNHPKLKRLIKVIDEIDTLRRELKHDETFGPYENIVDETLLSMNIDRSFTADDIPF